MTPSIYLAFLASVFRSLLLVGGGWLVSRGLVEDGLMREVAAGLGVIIATQVLDFVAIHRRRLYQRWLVALGLDSPADSDPTEIDQAARKAARQGLQP